MSYGEFRNDSTEYVVHTPDPVHVIDNYLYNDKVFSHVTQTGLGYIWYDHRGTEITRITPGGECESAYDKFYNRVIYVRDNRTGEFFNLNWEPIGGELDHFECVHGLGYSVVTARKNGIEAELTVFVPPGEDPLEIWQLAVRNRSGRKRDISVFVYNEISFHSVDTYGERVFMHGDLDRGLNGMVCTKRAETLPHDHFTAFFVSDRKINRYDCSRGAFLGATAMMNRPAAVERGRCSNTVASCEHPVTAAQYDLKLGARRQIDVNCLLGIAPSRRKIQSHAKRYLVGDGIARAFRRLTRRNAKLRATNTVRSPDGKLDLMTNTWNKQQIDFFATWNRWGMRGYREMAQQAMSLSLFDPPKARGILLTAMRFQRRDGSGLRHWIPIDERPLADQGLWLVYAVAKYLQETGDLELLRQQVPYFDGGKGSAYDHLQASLDFNWNNRGKHGLCLIKSGDWNDSLTAVGKGGRGESVWLTMGLGRALLDVAEVAEIRGDAKLAAKCRRRHGRLKNALNEHAWEDDRYVRCFDDQGEPVGSASNPEGKLYLNTQSWGVLSEVASPDQFTKALATLDRELSSKLGYLLLTPTYLRSYSHIGRITHMEPGVAENGTVYSHGNAFMMLACLQRKMADKAYDIYRRNTPTYEPLPAEVMGPVPYVVANGYRGPDYAGGPMRTEYSWCTASAAWYYMAVVEWLFGLRSEYAGLRIDPCLPSRWKECSAVRIIRGKTFRVRFTRTRRGKGNAPTIVLNGSELDGNLIDVERCPSHNRVEVLL